jgi:Ca2+-binding EF-hand superfamily protein
MRLLAMSVVAAAIVATASVRAGAQSGGHGDLPQAVADGFYVTLQEVRAHSRETFESFAGPGGGPVPRDQFVSTELAEPIGPSGRNQQLLGRLFNLLDTDDSGSVSRAEWDTQIRKDLSFADANVDGRISLKELANARENMGFGEALGLVF